MHVHLFMLWRANLPFAIGIVYWQVPSRYGKSNLECASHLLFTIIIEAENLNIFSIKRIRPLKNLFQSKGTVNDFFST